MEYYCHLSTVPRVAEANPPHVPHGCPESAASLRRTREKIVFSVLTRNLLYLSIAFISDYRQLISFGGELTNNLCNSTNSLCHMRIVRGFLLFFSRIDVDGASFMSRGSMFISPVGSLPSPRIKVLTIRPNRSASHTDTVLTLTLMCYNTLDREKRFNQMDNSNILLLWKSRRTMKPKNCQKFTPFCLVVPSALDFPRWPTGPLRQREIGRQIWVVYVQYPGTENPFNSLLGARRPLSWP